MPEAFAELAGLARGIEPFATPALAGIGAFLGQRAALRALRREVNSYRTEVRATAEAVVGVRGRVERLIGRLRVRRLLSSHEV